MLHLDKGQSGIRERRKTIIIRHYHYSYIISINIRYPLHYSY